MFFKYNLLQLLIFLFSKRYTGIYDCNNIEIKYGDTIKGLVQEGQSQVFMGDYDDLQPFSYLNDYEDGHFEIVERFTILTVIKLIYNGFKDFN